MPTVADQIVSTRDRLSPAERRVAEIVLDDPQSVAFGTVASLASRAGVSKPSVVRMAERCGFDGFVGLQAAVQEELAARLGPAAERIRERPVSDPLGRALDIEIENVRATLSGVDAGTFRRVVSKLARGRAGLASGEATWGVVRTFADSLGMLGLPPVLVEGSPVRAFGRLSTLRRGDVFFVVDVRRYDKLVVDLAVAARAAGLQLVAVTDGLLSPLAEPAGDVFVVDAAGTGPFDSHVGTLALLNALATAVAAEVRRSAQPRLDRMEASWTTAGVLLEG